MKAQKQEERLEKLQAFLLQLVESHGGSRIVAAEIGMGRALLRKNMRSGRFSSVNLNRLCAVTGIERKIFLQMGVKVVPGRCGLTLVTHDDNVLLVSRRLAEKNIIPILWRLLAENRTSISLEDIFRAVREHRIHKHQSEGRQLHLPLPKVMT